MEPVQPRKLLLWKWSASNRERGDVRAVERLVLRGLRHPALVTFDPEPFLEKWRQFNQELNRHQIPLTSVCHQIKAGSRTLALRIEWNGGDERVLALFGRIVDAAGLTGCECGAGDLLPWCSPKRYKLTLYRIEAGPDRFFDPPLEEMVRMIARVDQRLGVYFAVLESAAGNYVQVTGREGLYYVEWREFYDPEFVKYGHYAAGVGEPSGEKVRLGESDFYVDVYESELLGREDVQLIFSAFYRGEQRPQWYHWRDITEEVKVQFFRKPDLPRHLPPAPQPPQPAPPTKKGAVNRRDLFLWKWADNDAIQDPEDLCVELEKTADAEREGKIPAPLVPFHGPGAARTLQKELYQITEKVRGLTALVARPWPNKMHVPFLIVLVQAEDADPSPVINKVVEFANEKGFAVYDRTKGRYLGKFGPKFFELRGWKGEITYDPSLEVVLRRLEEVDTELLVPFIVLSRRDGGFVQAMCTDGDYRVEWADIDPQGNQRQYVADKPDAARRRKLEITSGKNPGVSESAALSYAEAKVIFTAFYRGEPRPSQFTWVDITDMVM